MDDLRNRMLAEFTAQELLDRSRAHGRRYIEGIRDRHVAPKAGAVDALGGFDRPLPEKPGDALSILDTLFELGSPATTAQIGGRFFGLVNGGVIPVALAARQLADIWDQNAVLFKVSPIAARLEQVCERWLRELLGLPEETVAGFVSGTSMAIFCGLAAARYRLLERRGWDVNAQGLNGAPPLRIVTGAETHGAVIKAVALLGFGVNNIEFVPCDEQGRMMTAAMPEIDDRTILILQAGNVNSGAFDPIDDLTDVAMKKGAWVHVDGAFGLWAGAARSLRYLTKGMAKAQSWSADGHKTLNTTYDNGVVLCRDAQALHAALQARGDYLPFSGERDPMLLTPEMSRRARGIELWATLAYLGRDGVDMLVGGLHARACQAGLMFVEHGFEVMNDVVFNQVVIGFDDPAFRDAMIDHIVDSGECWVGPSSWKGRAVIRFSVCSWMTGEEEIGRAVQAFIDARREITERMS